MPFQVLSLDRDAVLAAGSEHHAVTADADVGYPCRVTLQDAKAGEKLFLVAFAHQPLGSHQSSGPIFVRESGERANPAVNEVPDMLLRRLLSVRAYDHAHTLIDAEVTEGHEAAAVFEALFANKAVAYLHVHNAKPGCFNCRVDRA